MSIDRGRLENKEKGEKRGFASKPRKGHRRLVQVEAQEDSARRRVSRDDQDVKKFNFPKRTTDCWGSLSESVLCARMGNLNIANGLP